MGEKTQPPACFGILEKVFPLEDDGFRNTPASCSPCPHKTPCLKSAMSGSDGLKVREEMVDRAYRSGVIGFFKRWSQKKTIYRQIKKRRAP